MHVSSVGRKERILRGGVGWGKEVLQRNFEKIISLSYPLLLAISSSPPTGKFKLDIQMQEYGYYVQIKKLLATAHKFRHFPTYLMSAHEYVREREGGRENKMSGGIR